MLVPVKDVAETLGIRQQVIYHWLREGLIKGEKIGRSQCVDPKEAKRVLEEEKNGQSKGGRKADWSKLVDYLKATEKDNITLKVDEVGKIIESPETLLEKLYYWDPYRVQYASQAPGIRAIREAGFDLTSIDLKFSERVNLVGVFTITITRREKE